MRTLAQRYELVELLGSGGMAQVWRAEDALLRREVAVKLVREGLADATAKERLLREARAAARLVHPNAVTVFDTGEEDGHPYIVMELVVGETLAAVVARRGRLPEREAVTIADDVLAALQAAHDQGLVHRDVKPANVLLPADGGGAKLADFGIAKGLQDAAQGLTATGQVLGTPRYLAPEQSAGARAGPAADLYAVGVLLYEMVTGRPPFSGPNALAVALAHQRETAPPLTEAAPEISPAVTAAVHRALEKDPRARFGSAADMRAALAGADLPPTVSLDGRDLPPTVPLRGRPRRGSGVAAVVAAVAVLGAGALVLAALGDEEPVEEVTAQETTAPVDDGGVAAVEDDPQPQDDPEPPPEPMNPQLTSIEQLLAFLEQDASAAGEKGPDLRDKLEDVLGKEDRKRSEEARKLANEVDKWVEEGKLDAHIGEQAIVLLEQLAAEEREGRARGQEGREDEDDDD